MSPFRRRPTTALAAYERLLEEELTPRLAELGFRRQRATFHRAAGRNWEVVHVQKSLSSGLREVAFTVNLAVGWAALRRDQLAWVDGQRPAHDRCQFRERLGVVGHGEDVWYDVTRWTNAPRLAARVAAAIEEDGLPWLEGRSTGPEILALMRSDAVLQGLSAHELPWFAEAAASLGEDALAAEVRALAVARARTDDPAT